MQAPEQVSALLRQLLSSHDTVLLPSYAHWLSPDLDSLKEFCFCVTPLNFPKVLHLFLFSGIFGKCPEFRWR